MTQFAPESVNHHPGTAIYMYSTSDINFCITSYLPHHHQHWPRTRALGCTLSVHSDACYTLLVACEQFRAIDYEPVTATEEWIQAGQAGRQ